MNPIWRSVAVFFAVCGFLLVAYNNKPRLENLIYLNIECTAMNSMPPSRCSSTSDSSADDQRVKIVEAAPWLLSPSSAQQRRFAYRGLENDLDALLKVMAGDEKKIAILKLNRHWQKMIQNNIYTLVHFGLVRNYVVLVGDELSLQVCIELNLPCYNGSTFLSHKYRDLQLDKEAAYGDKRSYRPLIWSRGFFNLEVLRRGYTTISADADIAYAKKDVWASFERYAGEVGADMVFMNEPPLNAGHFYAVSSERVIALMEEWLASEPKSTGAGDQHALNQLSNRTYVVCKTKKECDEAKKQTIVLVSESSRSKYQNNIPKMVTVRVHVPPTIRFGSVCPPPDDKRLDPCASDCLYIHAICILSERNKTKKLDTLGFWWLNEPCHETTSTQVSLRMNVSVIRCIPKVLTLPLVEEKFMR